MRFILFLVLSTTLSHAIDKQIDSYQKLVLAQYEQLDKAKALQVETQEKIDGYVADYQKLWGIEKTIEFKCADGIKSLPHYSSVTPNTDLGKLITRNCEYLEKLKTAETSTLNNITKIQNLLKEYNVAMIKDSSDSLYFADTSIAPFTLTYNESVDISAAVSTRLDSVTETQTSTSAESTSTDNSKDSESTSTTTVEMVITDTYNSEAELETASAEVTKFTDAEFNAKISDEDKAVIEEVAASNAVEAADKAQEAACSVYDQTCSTAAKWPAEDTEIKGITCFEMRKKDGQVWKARYNYKCSGQKVILLSDHYQYKKLGECSLGSKNSNNLTIIKDGAPVFWRTKSGGFQVYACLNGKSRITVGAVMFKGVACKDHGKKVGDSWETFGPTIESECSGMCYVDKKVNVKKATKLNWYCDSLGQIIPGSKSYVGKSTQIKRVQIDGLVRYQRVRPDKYISKACEVSERQIQSEIRCDLTQKEMLTCPEKYPVAVTQAERDMVDDMAYGLAVESCEESSLYSGSNQCGGSGTKFLKCKKQCRTKCEEPVTAQVKDYKLVDYYPNAVRTDSVK